MTSTTTIITRESQLPSLFAQTSPPPKLLTQGAEALVYQTHFASPNFPCALKYRPPKTYRHPALDKRLTRHRILSEARILVKCRREGVQVPGVLSLDAEGDRELGIGGWMMMEWIEGQTVKQVLLDRAEQRTEERDKHEAGTDPEQGRMRADLRPLMGKIGKAVARMHEIGIVHGDLTTSNMMLRSRTAQAFSGDGSIGGSEDLMSKGDIVLIDFGLAGQSIQDEDKAVDLYVLEKAFGSTHPKDEESFQEVLQEYGQSYRGAKVVLKKLEDVRMRGRKKSMVG